MKIMQSAGNTSTMPPPTDCVTHHEFPSELINLKPNLYDVWEGAEAMRLISFFNKACEVHAHSVRTQPYNTKAALIRTQQNIRDPASCQLSQSSIPQSFDPAAAASARSAKPKDIFLDIFSQTKSTNKVPALSLCFCKTS